MRPMPDNPAKQVDAPTAPICEVALGPPGGVELTLVLCLVGGVVFGLTVAFVSESHSVLGAVLLALPAPTLAGAVVLLIKRTARENARRQVTVDNISDLHTLVVRLLARERRVSLWVTDITRGLLRGLVDRGWLGAVLRIGPTESATPVEPLTVPFEALPVDESTAAFAALEREQDPTTAEPHTSWARINRKVALTGGWVSTICFFAMILFQALGSLGQRRVSPWLFVGLALLAGMLFFNAGAFRSGMQWLMVPGGLIVRRAGLLDRGWRVHLFERPNSILLVYSVDRRKLILRVTDAIQSEETTVTNRECRLILRAWLSPLSPPSPQQLSDLA